MVDAVNSLARDYRVQLSADGSTNWLTVYGLNDLNPAFDPTKVDSTDYESDGWAASEITLNAWSLAMKLNVKSTAGVQDAAFTLLQNCQGEFGDSARVYARWFRKDGLPGAWSGRGIVSVVPSKTGVTDLNEQTVTVDGDGKPTKISNPYAADSAPSLAAATPSAAAEGDQVTITGAGFTGTTGVKFGTTAATGYVVLGDSVIVAVMPAGSAGAANVTVTNATGTSDPLAYTRGA